MKRAFILTILLFLTCIGMQSSNKIDLTTVKQVDLNRYMGTWYEIARFDHSFERGLVGVTATYTLLPGNKIQVINKGYKSTLSGKESVAKGKAKVPDPNEPGKLKVSFFLWFYADYYILELDEENYSYALIGSSSDKYLWILSRTPILPENTLNRLLEKARKRGYDTDNLIFVPQ